MPRKVAPARGQRAKHTSSQELQTSKEGSHHELQGEIGQLASERSEEHGGYQTLINGSRATELSQLDPYEHVLYNTSQLYSDMSYVSGTIGTYEKCKTAVEAITSKGKEFAQKEYRNLYASLIKIDRVSLKNRNDSGDLQAAKQWKQFCEDTVKLLRLRYVLFDKPVMFNKVGNRMGFPDFRGPHHVGQPSPFVKEDTQIHSSEVERLGKVSYTILDVDGAVTVPSREGKNLFHSDDFGDAPFAVDMSKWVRKGAVLPTSNHTMQVWMTMAKLACGDDMQSIETSYQLLFDHIKDVDEELLANQAEAGITKDATERYREFTSQCFQLVVLWQLIYKLPIPVKIKQPASTNRPSFVPFRYTADDGTKDKNKSRVSRETNTASTSTVQVEKQLPTLAFG